MSHSFPVLGKSQDAEQPEDSQHGQKSDGRSVGQGQDDFDNRGEYNEEIEHVPGRTKVTA